MSHLYEDEGGIRNRRYSAQHQPTVRAPLQDLNVALDFDGDATATASMANMTALNKRRVSFNNKFNIKEFNAEDRTDILLHAPEYEEPLLYMSSDSSCHPTSVSASSVSHSEYIEHSKSTNIERIEMCSDGKRMSFIKEVTNENYSSYGRRESSDVKVISGFANENNTDKHNLREEANTYKGGSCEIDGKSDDNCMEIDVSADESSLHMMESNDNGIDGDCSNDESDMSITKVFPQMNVDRTSFSASQNTIDPISLTEPGLTNEIGIGHINVSTVKGSVDVNKTYDANNLSLTSPFCYPNGAHQRLQSSDCDVSTNSQYNRSMKNDEINSKTFAAKDAFKCLKERIDMSHVDASRGSHILHSDSNHMSMTNILSPTSVNHSDLSMTKAFSALNDFSSVSMSEQVNHNVNSLSITRALPFHDSNLSMTKVVPYQENISSLSINKGLSATKNNVSDISMTRALPPQGYNFSGQSETKGLPRINNDFNSAVPNDLQDLNSTSSQMQCDTGDVSKDNLLENDGSKENHLTSNNHVNQHLYVGDCNSSFGISFTNCVVRDRMQDTLQAENRLTKVDESMLEAYDVAHRNQKDEASEARCENNDYDCGDDRNNDTMDFSLTSNYDNRLSRSKRTSWLPLDMTKSHCDCNKATDTQVSSTCDACVPDNGLVDNTGSYEIVLRMEEEEEEINPQRPLLFGEAQNKTTNIANKENEMMQDNGNAGMMESNVQYGEQENRVASTDNVKVPNKSDAICTLAVTPAAENNKDGNFISSISASPSTCDIRVNDSSQSNFNESTSLLYNTKRNNPLHNSCMKISINEIEASTNEEELIDSLKSKRTEMLESSREVGDCNNEKITSKTIDKEPVTDNDAVLNFINADRRDNRLEEMQVETNCSYKGSELQNAFTTDKENAECGEVKSPESTTVSTKRKSFELSVSVEDDIKCPLKISRVECSEVMTSVRQAESKAVSQDDGFESNDMVTGSSHLQHSSEVSLLTDTLGAGFVLEDNDGSSSSIEDDSRCHMKPQANLQKQLQRGRRFLFRQEEFRGRSCCSFKNDSEFLYCWQFFNGALVLSVTVNSEDKTIIDNVRLESSNRIGKNDDYNMLFAIKVLRKFSTKVTKCKTIGDVSEFLMSIINHVEKNEHFFRYIALCFVKYPLEVITEDRLMYEGISAKNRLFFEVVIDSSIIWQSISEKAVSVKSIIGCAELTAIQHLLRVSAKSDEHQLIKFVQLLEEFKDKDRQHNQTR